MSRRDLTNILFVSILSFQISLRICSGTSQVSTGQGEESNFHQKRTQKRANFRVLEEPRPESLHHSYHNLRHSFLENLPTASTNKKVSDSQSRYSLQNRNSKKRPSANGNNGPFRRQGVTEAPKLDITSVSPIQSSLGGLTGLQGLPPLSLIQFVKLLVAVTPFIIPIVFVPLLIFTVGMFMIPVNKASYFIDGDDGVGKSRSVPSYWTSWGSYLVPSVTDFAKKVANHEECIERLTCEIGRKYLPPVDKENISGFNRSTLQRILNYFNHPLMHRISRSLRTSPDACVTQACGGVSFLEKYLLPSNSSLNE